MQTFYFTYRIMPNSLAGGCRLMPNMSLYEIYPELKGVLTMECEVIPYDKYKKWSEITGLLQALESVGAIVDPETKSGAYVAKVTVNTEALAFYGKDLEYIKAIIANDSGFKVVLETNISLAEFIRTYTNLVELEPNLFEISPETTSTIPGMEAIVPQVVLDLR